MPHSPLAQRHGLDAAWVRTPRECSWSTMRDFLVERLPKMGRERIDEKFAAGEFFDDEARPLAASAPYRPHRFVWFHRDLRDEPVVPFDLTVLHRDERLVVVDKPHFLATIPRGRHVVQSVVVRARRMLEMPDLVPAHRLDRVTAGVLLLTTERRWRGPYQAMFESGRVAKEYEAIAAEADAAEFPRTVRSHIRKQHGVMQATEIEGAEPNAETHVELRDAREGVGRYRVTPRTGKTHQIRLHMSRLGVPIIGDPFYPVDRGVSIDDFSDPLQLLAKTLRFTDPVDGRVREFTSSRTLSRWAQAEADGI